MKRVFMAIFGGVALMASSALAADQCPANVDPLNVFTGTWAFKCEAVTPVNFPPVSIQYGIAGQIRASVNSSGRGVTNTTATTNYRNTVTRLETDAGSFQVSDDCSRFTLVLNFSSRPIAHDCWFYEGFSKAFCVSILDSVFSTCRLAR